MPRGIYIRTEECKRALRVPRPGAGIYVRDLERMNTVKGEARHWWKGGKARCLDCDKLLSTRRAKRCLKHSRIGKLNPAYKQVLKYGSYHSHISKVHGKPSVCENPECKGLSTHYEWALRKGMQHSRNRDSYLYDDIYNKRANGTL